MPRRALALAILSLLLAAPAAAHAGTYHVYTCAAGGKVYPNGAFKTVDVPGVVEDSSCAGSLIALTVPAGARMADDTSSALTFTSPPNTTILDFVLTRQISYTNPVAEKTHKYFLYYSLGPTVFAGAGNYYDPTRNALNAQKQWYGFPDGNVAVAKSAVSAGELPRAGGLQGRRDHARAARRLLQARDRVLGRRGRRDQPHPARLRRHDQRPDGAHGDRRGVRDARRRRRAAGRTPSRSPRTTTRASARSSWSTSPTPRRRRWSASRTTRSTARARTRSATTASRRRVRASRARRCARPRCPPASARSPCA